MRVITIDEFKKNIEKYTDIACTEKPIISREDGLSFEIKPVNKVKEEKYNPEFVKSILLAKEEADKGNYVEIKDVNNPWKDILSD